MTQELKVGDTLPAADLHHMTDGGPQKITTSEIFDGKKVILFAVPGAFTPTCTATHLPGYVVHADHILAKGVDTIACLSVNDPFVMGAWGTAQNADNILMLADGSGEFTAQIGAVLDLTSLGLGKRSERYAMLVEDGVVSAFNKDEPGEVKVSSAEAMLQLL